MPIPNTVTLLTAPLVFLFVLLQVCQCVPPQDLTNLHNRHACPVSTFISRPTKVKDIQEVVKQYSHVRATGNGFSFLEDFTCASSNGTGCGGQGQAVNIQMSTLRPRKIKVSEHERAVWVDASVVLYDLLQYLSKYVTKNAPTGYTLGMIPLFTFSTVGGAVSTGSHGSSLVHNSLSSQVLALEMVVANGSLVRMTPESHPFLFRAAKLSVGRLGIITKVKFRIVRDGPMYHHWSETSISKFMVLMRELQDYYKQHGDLPEQYKETNWYWDPQPSEILEYILVRGDGSNTTFNKEVANTYKPSNTSVLDVIKYNSMLDMIEGYNFQTQKSLPVRKGTKFDGPNGRTPASSAANKKTIDDLNQPLPQFKTADGQIAPGAGKPTTWAKPKPAAANAELLSLDSETSKTLYFLITRAYISIIRENDGTAYPSSRLVPYLFPETLPGLYGRPFDQYHVSFPVRTMADCLAGLFEVAYGDDIDSNKASTRAVDKGLRLPAQLRFVGKEDAFMSMSYDEPRLTINMLDFIYYNSNDTIINTQFRKMMAYLRSSKACGSGSLNGGGGRLHWGFAGWPEKGCWRGDEEYPGAWCDFGCAVQQLDPTGKFVGSAADRWNWNGVNLKRCCGSSGFLYNKKGCKCKVKHARSKKSCPPSPYYTGL